MAHKLGSLFFSTAKRMLRLQRQAFKAASTSASLIRPKSKKVVKRIKRAGPGSRSTDLASTGLGSWQNLIHKTAPTSTDLLGRLAYSLYKPLARPLTGMPLVVMLHGCEQSAHDLALGSGMNRLADSKGFVVVYPQQAERINSLRCWSWFAPDAAHGFAQASAIAGLVKALVSRHRLDSSRVYIAGLSAGAGMAGLVALRHPELFAALAMHSGAVLGEAHSPVQGMRVMRHGARHAPASLVESLVSEPESFPGMPAIILHGQDDHVVAPINAAQLTQQFVHVNWAMSAVNIMAVANGTDISEDIDGQDIPRTRTQKMGRGSRREYQREDFIRDKETVVRFCLINDLGHAWSGGDDRVKFHATGGPKASLLIWQFFDKQRRIA